MKYDKDIVVKWFAEHGVDAWPEYRFHPERKWRFDFSMAPVMPVDSITVPARGFKVALEVEGGIWVQGGGRHNRGVGMKADMEKYNEAAALGWRIIRVTPDQLCLQETVDLIKRALNA